MLQQFFVVVVAVGVFLLGTSITTIEGACRESEWECDNGDCIALESLCNGSIECRDGSDEHAYHCMQQICPAYTFRCSYGGCIRKQLRCDGTKDCADGSDEALRLCEEPENFEKIFQSSCSKGEFECSPGKCLEKWKVCDGKFDCENKKDESILMCAFNTCPKYSFQCSYGACLSPSAKCNNNFDCFDLSDEAYELCGFVRISNAIDVEDRNEKLPKRKGGETKAKDEEDEKVEVNTNPEICLLPKNRPHLIIKPRGRDLQSVIGKNWFVDYSCEEGFSLVGKALGFCEGPYMVPGFPKCEKYCKYSEILGDFSLRALQCRYGEEVVKCEELASIKAGTRAELNCAAYFIPQQPKSRVCGPDGSWSPFTNDCQMYCGTTLNPFARGGIDVVKGDIPWHIGIYAKLNERIYDYTCGGSILSPLVIISAAHCLFDPVENSAKSADLFQIIAGKFYRDYYKSEPDSQVRNVSEIIIHRNYEHTNLLVNDLALVRLSKPFYFTSNIRPICLGHVDHFQSSRGLLSAWGLSESADKKYETLQVVGGEHFLRENCIKKHNEIFPGEKFCTEYANSGLACRGDSGGGYFIKVKKQHYLIGVLSNAEDTDATGCSYQNSLLFFTNTSYYIQWIRENIRDIERSYKIQQLNGI